MLSEPKIMGIVNVTPDSFSDGGQFLDLSGILAHIEQLILDGADVIDIGAQSTRPGSEPVSVDEELARLRPVLSVYTRHFLVPLSVDTSRSEVAAFSLDCGASVINDVTGLTGDDRMLSVLGGYSCQLVLMHALGVPKTMQDDPVYSDVLGDVKRFFERQLSLCQDVSSVSVILDPGIGFGKNLEHNLLLLQGLGLFVQMGCPVLVGTSRKSFIGDISGADVSERLGGTIASTILAWQKGASYFRVHDVAAMAQAFQVCQAIEGVSVC